MQFESLNEVIADAETEHREELYFAFMTWQRAIQDERYKLIEYCVDGERHTQLFDLQEDPHEMNNLIPGGEHLHRMSVMRNRLRELAGEFNDGDSTSDHTTQMGQSFWEAFDTSPIRPPAAFPRDLREH